MQLNQAGTYAVAVSNLLGSATSSNATLTVYTVPVITSFSPQSGAVGTVVNISGLNFDPTPGNNTVYFGAVQAVVTAASRDEFDGDGAGERDVCADHRDGEWIDRLRKSAVHAHVRRYRLGDQPSSFAPRQDLPAGNSPYRVIIADLDGDGKPDLVVANVSGNTISLYRNISTNGSLTAGSFAPPVDLVTPPGSYSPMGLAVADVDGDGKLDIIVSDYDESIVSVYRNTCTPGNITSNSFATRVDFATGAQPQGVEVRDMDGDGKPDLLVANSGDGTVSILRNTGVVGSLTTNSFAPKVDIVTGSGCDSVAVGDLDGDGKPDVVTANNGSGTVSLLRNISTPGSITTNSFAAKVDIAVLSGPVQVAIGDLDGDGKPDLTVTFYLPQTVSVLRNTSTVGSLTTNSFAPRIDFSLGGRGHTPAIADLDGDGKPDLAVVTELNSLLSIFRNVSTPGSFTNSSFAGRVDFSTGYNAWGVAIGDLDGDGRPDIVFCNQYDNTISIYQNVMPFGGPPVILAQPSNQVVYVGFTANFSVTATGSLPLSYQWSFGGTNIVGATNTTLTLTNVQLSQAGTYVVLVTNVAGTALSSNAVLTVNPVPSNNVPVITGFSPISGFVGTSVNISGTNFSPVASNNTVYFGAVQAVVTAASATNLVVTMPAGATYAPITETIGGLVAYANTAFEPTFAGNGAAIGPSSFAPCVDMACGSGPYFTSIADLDGDGKPDLVTINYYDGNISLFRNISTNGTLSFAPRVDLPSFGGAPLGLAVADVDGDGKLDLVVSDSSNNRVVVYRNISTVGTLTTNSFAVPVAFSVGSSPAAVRVRDLDGDGKPDIVCVNYRDNTLSILRNIGTAGSLTTNSFAPQVVLATGSGPHDLVIVDLDGDGKPDLAQVNCNSSFLSVFRNVSVQGVIDTNSFAPRVDFSASGMGDSIIAGDGDGDGKVDLVVGWSIGSAVAVYRNLASPGSLDTNSFAAEVDFPAPGWVRGVAMGDLNGDGKLDISLVGEEGNFMSVYQNVSTPGSFTNTSLASRVDYGAGWDPHGVMIGDLDGDGRPDIIFGNQYDSTISIYQNVMPFGVAPIITTQPNNQTVIVGATASFGVTASGAVPLSYQWNFNGTNIVGATNTSLTLTNVQLNQAGNYAVLVTNLFGSILSSNAVLTVNPPPPCDPAPSGLVGWWPGEGNANDVVGGNNGTMMYGAAFTNGEVNQAFNLPGVSPCSRPSTGPEVLVPDSNLWAFGTNSFSIELWANFNIVPNNCGYSFGYPYDGVFISNDEGSGSNNKWWFALDDGKLDFHINGPTINSGSGVFLVQAPFTPQTNLWYHFAITRNGNVYTIYTNGIAIGSQTDTNTIPNPNAPLTIGAAEGMYFNGLLDEISIYNRALSSDEIAAIYNAGSGGKCFTPTPPTITTQPTNQTVVVGGTATFTVQAAGTPPLSYQWSFDGTNIAGATNTFLTLNNVQLNQAGVYSVLMTNLYGSILSSNAVLTVNPPSCDPAPSGLVSWWRAEGNANDSIGNNNGILSNDVSFAAGEVNSAFNMGTSGFVFVPPSASLNVGTNSGFTIEGWIYPTDVSVTLYPIFEWSPVAGNVGVHFYINVPPSAGNGAGSLFANVRDTGGGDHYFTTAANIVVPNAWQHVALTYNRITGVAVIYLNGSEVAKTSLGIFTPWTSGDLLLGYRLIPSQNYHFPGRLDEMSIYGRDLSASEIQAIYAAGSAGKCFTFAPPTITTQPTNQTVVVGSTATFSVTASGSLPLSYQWNFNGTNIDGATNIFLTLNNVQFNQAGVYSVLVTNLYGSILSSNATLTVNQPSSSGVPVIFAFSPISGVAGTGVTISGTNFSPVAASNIVYFGAVRAVVNEASVTNLVVTVPVGATYAPITETVNGLTAYANAPFLPTFSGNGSGIAVNSFAPQLVLPAGSGPIQVVIADLDGDGKPDLVVANDYGNTISLYRNISTNGSLTAGSFAPPVNLVTPPGSYSPMGLAVADVDGDGKLDIIVSDYDESIVSVYRNTCTPGNITSNSFATRVDFATGAQPQGVEVRDMDGDGKPDLLVANSGDGTVSILRNTGVVGSLTTNSFAPKVDIVTGSGCDSVAVGDLDGDGKPDVVTANNGSGTVSLLRNISTPGSITTNSFAAKVDIAVLSGPVQVAIGDLDGDGKPDLTVTFYLPQTVSVLRNTSTVGSLTTNSFAPRIDFSLGGRGHTPAIADLDGDGKPDLAVVTEINSLLSIFRNVSTPGSFTNSSFAGRVDFSTGYNAWGVAIGDLDGDGRPDIVFCNQYDNTISIYQNVMPFGGPPVILAQPSNQAVYVGFTANFSVTATGSLPLSYQWSFGGTNIVGATNTSLTLTNVQLNQAGNYTVLVTNAYGWTNSATAVLTVIALPPFIILQPTNQTIIVGTNVTFNVTAGGSLPLSYQWNFNGMNLNGATNATLTLINVQVTQAGNYAVLVTNAYGSVLSSNAVLTVNPVPVPVPANPRPANLATNVPANTNLMWDNGIGSQVISNGTFETGTLAGWNQVQSASGKFVINNGTFKPPGPDGPLPPYAGSYSALGEESGPGAFYMYQDVSIPSNATSATLSWAHRVRNFYTAFSSSQQFRVELLDTNNNVLAVAFTTQPGDPLLDNWVQKSYDVTSFAGQKLRVTFLVNSGLYYLNVHVDNVSVQVNGLSGAITNDVYLGTNPTPGPAEFQGSTTNSSWTLPLLAPLTTYYWQIVAHRGGSATGAVWQFTTAGVDHFVWSAISSPQYTNQPFGVVITAKDAFNTTVSNFNGSAALGATNGPISMVPTNTGAFIKGIWAGSVTVQQRATNLVLRASDGNGHTGTGNPFDVVPPNMPPVILAQPTNQTAVVGGTAMFMVAADGTPPLSYQWNFNGTNISGATNTSLTLTNVQLTQAGNYAVQVSNVLGLATSSNAILTVYTVPVITSFSPPAGAAGTVVNINGLNFDPTPGNNTVYFGAVQAVVTAASMTNLVVTVPAGATYAPITEAVGGLVAYANTAFEPTFLGDGSALGPSSFAPRVDLACGSGPYFTCIADLDGDGKPDVVTINYYDGNISLFRNISTNGTLSFAPRVDLPSFGGAPLGLAVADVDGDGKLDLVVSDSSNSRVVVYRNISTVGTLTTNSFAAPVAFSVGNTPVAVRVRDLDGDGRPDIVCVNSGDNTLSILRNIGTAGSLTTNSFAPQVVLATGPEPHDLVIVDLDGDGKPDLAQVNYTPSFFSVFRNTSVPGVINTNSFAARVDFVTSGEGDSIIVGDVDGDGKPDVIVGLASGSAISVYRNLACPGSLDTNSFAAEVDFPAPGWVRGVALGDLNGDGKPDISLIGEEGNFMSVYQNVSTPGSFTNTSLASRVDYGAGWDPHGVMIGDLDGDGRPDIIFGNQYDSTISIYQNIMPFGGPPVIATQPTNQTVIVSGTANFSVTASGTPPLSYQWNFNGTNIVGATNTTLTLINVQVRQAGNYAVLVTNVYGSATSIVATLSVAISPVIASQPKNQFVPLGCDATFNVCAWGTKPLSYQWWKDGLALSGQTNMSLTLTNVQTSDFGNYSVVVTNDFGSVTSSPAQLALGHPPVANPDTIYRFASGGVRVNVGGLLANDTDPDGDSLTIIGVSPNSAAGGTVGLTNNWVYYAPPGGSANGDTFTYIVSDGHCGTDVGTVTVQIKADNPQPLTFAIANPGDGFIRLTFDGIPGYTYWIEYTDDLSNPDWQTLNTETADGFGVCQFVDGSLTNAPARFYRAVWP